MNDIRQIFENDWCGMETFLDEVLSPIFGEYEKKYDILTNSSEVREKANFANITEIKHAASFDFYGSELKIFDVTVGDNKKLEKNKVGIQNIVRQYIAQFEGALLIFHHQNVANQEWRFSYVEKRKNAQDTTSAKRYTYILGKKHPAKTISERFEYLEKKKNNLILQDLTDAFSVETLTKEFYVKLFSWYEWAVKLVKYPKGKGSDVVLENQSSEEHLIRLITRLMFVWFIKQKHLVPNWIFDNNELSNILTDCDLLSSTKGNYYNAILQNLFFATLNKNIKERAFTNDDDRSEQYGIKTFFRDDKDNTFFKIDHNDFKEKFKSVPYLNGGLFECLDKMESGKQEYSDGFSREKSRRAFVPNILFWNEDESQLGLIPLLNRYNFTVEENTPTDVQVALDPELLGKVFENLLGTYNPETKETARKDSGSFYTPREIVDYMVNQSLISYLQNKLPSELHDSIECFVLIPEDYASFDIENLKKIQSAIDKIKILDPACGSGAFPMGVLHKLTQIRVQIDKLCQNIEKKDEDKTLLIKIGQSIYYNPTKGDSININIQAKYLGKCQFRLYIDDEDKGIYDSQKLALVVKAEINNRNKEKGKHTIANLFSQGRIETGKTFNTIKSSKDIHQIVDEEGNIIWQYAVYNVENKFRSYRNDKEESQSELDNDYEYSKYLYHLKKRIVENSIFGVDIQPIAVQIAKLRCFLSLVVDEEVYDEEVYDEESNRGIETLPNLETKFVAANSLIGLDKDEKDYLNYNDETIMKLKDDLIQVRKEHFNARTVAEKKANRETDEKLRYQIVEYLKKKSSEINQMRIKELKEYEQNLIYQIKSLPVVMVSLNAGGQDLFGNIDTEQYDKNETLRINVKTELKRVQNEIFSEMNQKDLTNITKNLEELVAWDPYDQTAGAASFFDADWMFGVKDGFDIVIGNPPYIQLQKDGGKLANLYENQNYKSFAKTGDVYCLFYEKGYNLLNTTGKLCFITSNKWMRAGYGEKLRDFFAKNVNPTLLVDFAGVKVFESATVDTNILMFEKGLNQGKTVSCLTTALTKNGLYNLSDFVHHESSVSKFNSSNSWVILSPIEQRIKSKIENIGTPLRDWNINIYRGVLTGYNDAFIINGEKRQEILNNCMSNDERERTDELIRPILRGRDIKCYSYTWDNLWLIYIPWHFPLQFDQTIQGASEQAEQEFKRQYPTVYKHLLGYKKELSSRNKAETGIRYEWYAMQRWGANYWEDFNKPKIVWKRVGSILRFSFDDKGCMALDSTCFAIGEHIKYLVGILNSKFGNYLLQDAPKTGTGDLLISVQAVAPILIPIPKKDFELQIENLLDRILIGDKNAEKEINIKVYELYGLTDEEIAFIENI